MTVSYEDVLWSHAERARKLGPSPARAALMSRSKSMRDILACAVTDRVSTSDQLRALLNKASDTDDAVVEGPLDPGWLAALGRVVALQELEATDSDFGLKCLQFANRQLPGAQKSRVYLELEAALLFEMGRYDEAQQLVRSHKSLRRKFFNYLEVDLSNPFLTGDFAGYDQWLSGFNRPFTARGLGSVSLAAADRSPFDRLTAEPASTPVFDAPMVSIVMTSYKPDPDAFFLAAESILKQSWRNLELVIVDDATPGGFPEVLSKIERIDERVKVLRLQTNGGTYKARNAGIAVAAGDYIAGQDSDDWSHPDRIYRQVRYLEDNPDTPGVLTRAIRTDDDLVRVARGTNPDRRKCEISLMVRSHIAREVGGYLPVRKGADTEFRWRIERYAGLAGQLTEPLYVIRLSVGSLSRSEFRPGWVHPVRRAFRNGFSYWHQYSQPQGLQLGGSLESSSQIPIPVPGKFQISPSPKRHFDVVFAGDWRDYGTSQRAMLDEIHEWVQAGMTVGILQMESVMASAEDFWTLDVHVQQLINEGVVGQVIPDEDAATDLLVVHDPTILQFPPSAGVVLSVEKVLVVADYPPARLDGKEALYQPAMCDTNAQHLFDAPVTWAAIDPAVTGALLAYQEEISVCEDPLPPVFDPYRWANQRKRLNSGIPVVGRHSGRLEALWPKFLAEAEKLWPSNGMVDVRILGDAQSKLKKYDQEMHSHHWVIFDETTIKPEAFMRSLDFFVYFPDPQWPQQYCREALEAEASGCVVILPEQFRAIHGEGPIYTEPEYVAAWIDRLARDPQVFQEHVRTASCPTKDSVCASIFEDILPAFISSLPEPSTQKVL